MLAHLFGANFAPSSAESKDEGLRGGGSLGLKKCGDSEFRLGISVVVALIGDQGDYDVVVVHKRRRSPTRDDAYVESGAARALTRHHARNTYLDESPSHLDTFDMRLLSRAGSHSANGGFMTAPRFGTCRLDLHLD